MNNLKPLPMVDKDGLISYWSKGAQNNYSSVKRILGVVKFDPSQLTHHQNVARKRGFNLTVGARPDDVLNSIAPTKPQELEPTGTLDKKNGILKTVTADWVINCVNGRLINKNDARFIGVSKKDGHPYWIHLEASIIDSPVAYPSVFGDVKPKPRRIECYSPVKKRETISLRKTYNSPYIPEVNRHER